MIGKHRTDGMNNVVPVEAFCAEASKRRHNDWFRQSKLAFHDGVHDRMPLSVRGSDAMQPMVFRREGDARLLIESKPFLWGWVSIRVVFFHVPHLPADSLPGSKRYR